MIDDLHHLARLHRHDDVRWAFLADDTIELRPSWSEGRADEQRDQLCRQQPSEAARDMRRGWSPCCLQRPR